ncbi:MAG: alpha/beta fold hydrolase [Gaiellales bacterium]
MPRLPAIAILALVTGVLALSSTASAADTHMGTTIASDGARIQYFEHGPADAPALLVSPAFTGSARLYADRFGSALPEYRVVVVQLRGHGAGGGCDYAGHPWCSPHQGPGDGRYTGLRISRLAMDLRDVRRHLHLTRTALMGHSIGMNVIDEYIADMGLTGVTGLFIYDQSPANLAEAQIADATFPSGFATYPTALFTQLIHSFGEWDATAHRYPNTRVDIRAMMGGPTGDPVQDLANPHPAFLLEESAWRDWMRFAGRINGKVISLELWSSLTNTYTDVYHQIAASGIPVLVYGGKSSVVPWHAMRWIHEQLPGSEFMLFPEGVGVHGIFLNPPPSGTDFMRRVHSFLDRRVRPRAT